MSVFSKMDETIKACFSTNDLLALRKHYKTHQHLDLVANFTTSLHPFFLLETSLASIFYGLNFQKCFSSDFYIFSKLNYKDISETHKALIMETDIYETGCRIRKKIS